MSCLYLRFLDGLDAGRTAGRGGRLSLPAGAPGASRISFPLRDSFDSSILRILDIDRGYVSARQRKLFDSRFRN